MHQKKLDPAVQFMVRCTKRQEPDAKPPERKDLAVIQLVLIYCLTKDALSCVERRPVLDLAPSPMACMMAAQPLAAQYLEEHPAYKLNSWRCEIRDRPERAASEAGDEKGRQPALEKERLS